MKMKVNKVGVTVKLTLSQREKWKALANFNKRSLQKQIEHEMDTSCDEMERNLQ